MFPLQAAWPYSGEVPKVLLYVASTALELAGLGLVLRGVTANRRTARDLRVQRDALEPRDARSASTSAKWTTRAGVRRSASSSFIGGTLAGLAANLLSA